MLAGIRLESSHDLAPASRPACGAARIYAGGFMRRSRRARLRQHRCRPQSRPSRLARSLCPVGRVGGARWHLRCVTSGRAEHRPRPREPAAWSSCAGANPSASVRRSVCADPSTAATALPPARRCRRRAPAVVPSWRCRATAAVASDGSLRHRPYPVAWTLSASRLLWRPSSRRRGHWSGARRVRGTELCFAVLDMSKSAAGAGAT